MRVAGAKCFAVLDCRFNRVPRILGLAFFRLEPARPESFAIGVSTCRPLQGGMRAPAPARGQNVSLALNWKERAPPAPVILPKFELVMSVFGSFQRGVLTTLNASARN